MEIQIDLQQFNDAYKSINRVINIKSGRFENT